MANNIKIVGNITNTNVISRYNEKDIKLIPSQILNGNFGGSNDYIEFYIQDAAENLLNFNYYYVDYKLPSTYGLTPATSTPPNTTGNIQTSNIGITSTLAENTSSLYPIIEIDPVKDIQKIGYSSGQFKTRYNFFSNILSNSTDRALFIKEISKDRTEIRLASTTLSNDEIENVTLSIIDEINTSAYYVEYILNFGNNIQYVAINVALNKAPEGYEILFKLYQPLDLSIQEKNTLWVVKEKVNPFVFDINLDKLILPPPSPTLRGPNFDISIPNQGTISTTYTTYESSLSNLITLQSSSYNQLLNLLNTQSININVNYTISESSDFGNFVFFGSAYQRTVNFYNKVKEIEDYTNFISYHTPYIATTSSLQSEINQYSSSISTTISQFDGYEYYLYFKNTPYTWPKSGSLQPYVLLSTGSTAVRNWYNALTASALEYDNINTNNLEYAIPSFIKDDNNNQPFLTFLNMVGHYFDNIWIYLKAITDVNLANNNLDVGISRDIVYQQLQSLGIKLYNSQAGESLSNYLIGTNSGSVFDPYYVYIGYVLAGYVSGSAGATDWTLNDSTLNNIPRKDLLSELYKRIYHNLPLLLKTKGTVAGLDYLMSIFGIPNQTYYTITSGSISNTYYTPTGSNITSSILNVKEFGGSLKSNLINGYNNDKVRILNNTITGSILSPLLSLQTYPTLSNQFRDDDLHYIDISFSPQTQIDTYISGAISSNNPTWSLDDYIGDPRQLYDNSYTDLNIQRNLYYQTGVSGYNPFTASLLDYNGFIRLIQFFDNALFKMLNDFVPERTSLSTGVTINSPVLERNKVSYADPTNSTTQSIYTAEYSASTISAQYGTFYNELQGDKKPFFTGELSGSQVDVHQYFVDNNNPYLTTTSASRWTVWNSQHPITQSINTNTFFHSDWNVLLNNVSKSIQSIYRQNIEYVWGTTGSILKSAELQDSYLSLRSYNISRYEGSKTTSLLYNTYSPATESYGGDSSYGKTAAIDHTVRKIGLFTQIVSSSLLPKRNAVSLKYLVDEFGNLTELNQINKNWWDIQRVFKAGNTASVSQFDNKKFSNQKSTDGNKLVFDSGYRYVPVLYGKGADSRLYFETTTDPSAYAATATNISSSYYLTGSSTLGYPISKSIVTNFFNNVYVGNQYMSSGGPGGGNYNSWPSYSVQEAGAHTIKVSFNLNVFMPTAPNSSSFSLGLYKTGSSTPLTLISSSTNTFTFASPTITYRGTSAYKAINDNRTQFAVYGAAVTLTQAVTFGGITYHAGDTLYRYDGFWNTYTGLSCDPVDLSNPLSNLYSPASPIQVTANFLNGCTVSGYGTYIYQVMSNMWEIPNLIGATTSQTKTFNINISSTTLSGGDNIQLRFTQSYSSNNNITASISSPGNSIFSVSSLATLAGNYPYITREYFSSLMTDPNSENTIILSEDLSDFYTPNYQFLPTFTSASVVYSSSLYSSYGDVDYPFQLNIFGIFSAYDKSGSYFESKITDISRDVTNNNVVTIKLANSMPFNLREQLTSLSSTSNRSVQFLFLNRIDDETLSYLTFTKRAGQTSYGFLVPENLAKDVLDNIDTITKQVKQKLLNDQGSIITDINGGGF
jgi:hypothetical protein